MRECTKCGGNATRDYAYGCDHVFDDTPRPLVEIVEARGEDVYHASANGASPHVLHPTESGAVEGWREAWRFKAHEDALHREVEAREASADGIYECVYLGEFPGRPGGAGLIRTIGGERVTLAPGDYTLRVDGEWRDVTVLPPAPVDGAEAEQASSGRVFDLTRRCKPW